MKFSLLISLIVGLLTVSNIHHEAEAACSKARVRKNWDSLTSSEKTTYKNAIAAAMDSGAYIKFVEMHTEVKSELEAHKQCMFTYWHRLLLVTFENMLRGQGSQYECVTVPYWDWVTAQSRLNSGTCKGMLDCSNITSELGGYSTSYPTKSLVINGKKTSGRCVSASPLNHFCENSSLTGSKCAKCLTRGDWRTASVPSSTSFSSVVKQIFTATSIKDQSPNVENNSHNNVHANLGGAITTLASPADPLFWSHHAMVDLLNVIFYKCNVGSQTLTFEQKSTNNVTWYSCARRDSGVFNPTDIITMRTGINGNNPIAGWNDTVIGKYFPSDRRFAAMADPRDLGSSSYSYDVSGYLATMYDGCNGQATTTAPSVNTPTTTQTPATSAPVSTTQAPITIAPTATSTPITSSPSTLSPSTPSSSRNLWEDWWRHHFGRFRFNRRTQEDIDPETGCAIQYIPATSPTDTPSDVEGETYSAPSTSPVSTPAPTTPSSDYKPATTPKSTSSPTPLSTPASTTPSSDYSDETSTPFTTPSTTSGDYSSVSDSIVISSYEETDVSVVKVINWYTDMATQLLEVSEEPIDELEYMACVFQKECLGGELYTYTAEQQEMFGDMPPCAKILSQIDAGEITFSVNNWFDQTVTHFGCPSPSDSSSGSAYTSSYSQSDNTYQSESLNDDYTYSIGISASTSSDVAISTDITNIWDSSNEISNDVTEYAYGIPMETVESTANEYTEQSTSTPI